jgi:hypothetical protein
MIKKYLLGIEVKEDVAHGGTYKDKYIKYRGL